MKVMRDIRAAIARYTGRQPGRGASILFAGHSHTMSLGALAGTFDGSFQAMPIVGKPSMFVMIGVRSEPAFWDAVVECARAAGHAVAVLWAGNQHLGNYLLAPSDPFDLVVADSPHLPVDPAAQILPESVFRTLFYPASQPGPSHLDSFLASLKAAGVPTAVVGTPPPKGDDDFIRRMMPREPHFIEEAERAGIDLGVVPLTPPLLRYKLWLVIQGVLRETASRHDLAFVAVPKATQMDDGFLRPEFFADDATHANAAYGDILATALYRHFGWASECIPIETSRSDSSGRRQ